MAQTTQQVDQLIHAKSVLPVEPINQAYPWHSVVIDQDKIIDILPTDQAKQYYQAKTVHDCLSHVVMPGLINAHTHSPMSLLRGYANDLKLMDWLENYMWPAEATFSNPDGILVASRLAMAQMIRSGVTCFNDMFSFPLQTAQAAIECGVRANLGYVIINPSTNWARDEKECLAKAEKIHQQQAPHPLISWSMAPHAPYTVSDEGLQSAKILANKWNIRLGIHLHETQQEVIDSIKQHQMRPIERLDKLGLLDNQSVAFHMVHLTDEEIDLVKQRQLHVVHCPESNLKLGSGIAPITQLVQAGINVSIGTDSVASNNDLDLLSEMRTASLLAKGMQQDPTVLPAQQVLQMTTLNGAKALALDHQIGSLLPGKQADIVAVNLDHPFTQPNYDPISTLIYSTSRSQISDVWVGGKQLLQNDQFTMLDYDKFWADSQPWIQQIQDGNKLC